MEDKLRLLSGDCKKLQEINKASDDEVSCIAQIFMEMSYLN